MFAWNITTNCSKCHCGATLVSVHKKPGKRSSEPLRFKHAAVSSDHHLCSEVGKSILQKGGSAVDSVIAVQFCVEVVNSHSTGIGGGGFMLVYDAKTGQLPWVMVSVIAEINKNWAAFVMQYYRGILALYDACFFNCHEWISVL